MALVMVASSNGGATILVLSSDGGVVVSHMAQVMVASSKSEAMIAIDGALSPPILLKLVELNSIKWR